MKTEHAGAKHGTGAFWGPKKRAKQKSTRKRRTNWQREIREALYQRDISSTK